jgi:hypothetical protein
MNKLMNKPMNKSINPLPFSINSAARENKMKIIRANKTLTALAAAFFGAELFAVSLFIESFPVAAVSGPTTNAGQDFTVLVGEAIRLDGSASSGYKSESQTDGTWSIPGKPATASTPRISFAARTSIPRRASTWQR